jgi:hypothetical protein
MKGEILAVFNGWLQLTEKDKKLFGEQVALFNYSNDAQRKQIRLNIETTAKGYDFPSPCPCCGRV